MTKKFCDRCGAEIVNGFTIVLRKSPIDQEVYDVCKRCYDNIHWWMTERKDNESCNT